MTYLTRIVRGALPLGAALAAVSLAAPPARSIEMTPALKKIVEAAKKEGEVRLHMGTSPVGGTDGVKLAEDGINKMFGTDIRVSFSPGPAYAALGTKILTEHQASQPASSDVYVATAVQIVPLMKRGLFITVDWRGLYPERIGPEMVEAGGQVVRHYTSLPGVIYNKSMAAQVTRTTSLEDFLKPEWKGKWVTTPYLAGFDVLIPDEIWGEKRTEAFVLKMSEQIGGLLGCGAEGRIASGEMPVHLIDCSGSAAFEPKLSKVLGLHILKETAWRRHGYVAIPKNARSPNAAILYALFYASPDGQEAMRQSMGYDQTDHPESRYRKVVKEYEAKGMQFRDVTIAWWQSQEGVTQKHRRLVKMLLSKAKR